MRGTTLVCLLVCHLLVSAGCDQGAGQRLQVAGTVTIDGQPLSGGTIQFVPSTGRPASSAILADGSFELASESVNRMSELGVLPGVYRVQVTASEIIDEKTIHWKAPEKYADFRTSGLEVAIDEPINRLVIELTWADDEHVPTSRAPDAANGLALPEGGYQPVNRDSSGRGGIQ